MPVPNLPFSLRTLATAVLAWSVALAAVHAASELPAGPQSTGVNGVTVKVSAANLADGATTWTFAVVLDTHSQELADDLAATVVLLTDDGRELRPLAWKGPGAGGHHREGTLEFAPPQPRPKTLEMKMQRPGEAAPRVFRWTLS
jgi:hypothetical protein